MPSAVQPEHWGKFAGAVARHAAIFGPPPAPTEPNRNGAPRLAPAFAEWLMCIPAGHITDALPRAAALKAIGNGVCPPQLAAAWALLTAKPSAVDRPSDMSLESHLMTDTAAASAEIHERQAAHRARVIESAEFHVPADRHEDGTPARIVAAAMLELAQVWREEAEYFTAAKRRGWKSTSEQYLQAAAHLVGFAQGLTSVVSTGTLKITLIECPSCGGIMADGQTFCAKCELVNTPFAGPNPPPYCARCDTDTHTCPGCGDVVNHDEVAAEGVPAHEVAAELLAGMVIIDDPLPACSHPDAQRSTLKSGVIMCTLCNETVGQAEQLAELVPGSKRGPVVTGDATLDYLSGAVDTYEPTAATPTSEAPIATPTPAVDNPFTSPAAPGSNRAPVARLTWAELGPLTAATYPVPRPYLSLSYVESLSRCGLSALLSDASKAGHLGPRRPSWSLIGGNAFHSAVETIERAAIGIGGADPASQHDNPYWTQFWEAALTYQVDELTASLAGTPYANPASWHTANKGLEGFDWWRVQGLDMILRYLKLHDTAWRACHTLLQVPADPAAEARTPGQVPRVPVLELPFTTTAGSTALTTTGFIDAAWLSTSTDYPTATLEVVDHKSGKSLPSEHFQLTEYADVLRRYLPANFGLPIVGRFYRARLGAYTPPIPLPQRPGQDEIDYRYQAADRAMKHAAFTPHPDNMCSSCGSVDFCPAQALRDGATSS